MKKEIKLFLGSSLTEFKDLRESLSNFIKELNEKFEQNYDFKLKLYRCDDGTQNPYISRDGTQSEINKNILNSDVCLFIFGEKLGENTKAEFDLAFEQFRKSGNKKPKIAVYFKKNANDTQEISDFKKFLGEEAKYYYTEFDKDSVIKLSILVGLNLVLDNPFKLEIENDNVTIDGSPIILNIEEIPQFKNNQDLLRLKEELKQINEKYLELKVLYSSNETKDQVVNEYIDICSKKKNIENSISVLQEKILKLSNDLIKHSYEGSLSSRMMKAKKYFESGEYTKALVVMDIEDIKSDYELESKIYDENIKIKSLTYLNELEMRIDILYSLLEKEDRFDLINESYKEIVTVVKSRGIRFDLLGSYLKFLNEQHYASNVVDLFIDSLLNILKFYDGKISDDDLPSIYYSIAEYYDKCDNFDLAEENYKNVLTNGLNSDSCDIYFLKCINKLLFLYLDNKEFEKCFLVLKTLNDIENNVSNYIKTQKWGQICLLNIYLSLGKITASSNLDKALYYFYLAEESLNQISDKDSELYLENEYNYYFQIGTTAPLDVGLKAEHLSIAKEIAEKLVLLNPSKYLLYSFKVNTYLGQIYIDQNLLPEAGDHLVLAFASLNTIENNRLYMSEFLKYQFLKNIGKYYLEINDIEISEKYLLYSKVIIEKLYSNNKRKYCIDYSHTLQLLGMLNDKKGSLADAEAFNLEAIKIIEQFDKPTLERDLYYASICNSLGVIYDNQNKSEESIAYYKKAIEIYESSIFKNSILLSQLLVTLMNTICFYTNAGDYKSAEKYYSKALGFTDQLLNYSDPQVVIDVIQVFISGYVIYKNMSMKDYYEECLTRAVECCDKLFEINEYSCYMTDIIYNVFFIYSQEMEKLGEADTAFKYLLKSAKIVEQCFIKDNETFKSDYLEIMSKLNGF